MKIGFDAKRLFQNYTGLGNYGRIVVRDLQKYFPEHEYHLYTPKAQRNSDTELFFDKSKFTIHESKAKFKSYWRSFSIIDDLKRDGIELYHGLSAELPFGIKNSGINSVVTIHDLIFKYFPTDYKFIDRLIYDYKSKYACVNANKIISISDYTVRDIQKAYEINKDKVSVVYLPVDSRFSNEVSKKLETEIRIKFELPDKYFLYVGSVIGRKNLKCVINAMSLIERSKLIPLVIVGSGKKYMDEVKELISKNGLDNYVVFLKYISNEDLPIIYRLSSFFVFPSIYEGFGLPVLEAIQSGRSVIVSDKTSLVEVTGNCGAVLPQNNVDSWAKEILNKLESSFSSYDFVEGCKNHLKKFNSKELASKMMRIYKSI